MPSDPPQHISEALRSLRKQLAQPRTDAEPVDPAAAHSEPRRPASTRRIIRPGVSLTGDAGHGSPTTTLPPGSETASADGELAYVITQSLDARGAQWQGLAGVLPTAPSPAGEMPVPPDALFVDIETTGLSPSLPLFLIGTLALEEGALLVRQFLARDYSEERAAISLFLDHAARRTSLVTYNGRTFDLPYIRTRARAHRLVAPLDAEHRDLLPTARRVWGPTLPDCKLQTLERHLLGRERQGDIPGSRVPEAYHEFVATGDTREMVQVLEHNLLDLATMAELVVKLGAAH